MPRNNRACGHQFECDLATIFRTIGFPEAATTRQMGSKGADDAGVDLVGTPGWTVQAKYTKIAPNMHNLLESMPKEGERFNSGRRIVVHKRANQGSTVTMTLEDFVGLATEIRNREEADDMIAREAVERARLETPGGAD